MRVLITGIDGFTGQHLEKFLLKNGFEVFGTVISDSPQENYLTCNIQNQSEVLSVIERSRPEYIIHLAAISFVGEENASLIYDVNILGTQNILDALLKASITPKKVILASSATVYGNQNSEILDESMCPKPVNHYGISKLAMEHVAQTYFNKLDIIITRPFNYSGVGQAEHFLIPKIVKHYTEKKKEVELGNLHVAREFNDVDYVIHVYYELMISEIKSQIVNLSSNKAIKLLDVIDAMNELAGYSIDVKVNPAFVRENEIASLSGSCEKLYALIPKASSFQNDFKKMLQTMYLT
jgi:nucleoside-diphosphate-sugar epimerase